MNIYLALVLSRLFINFFILIPNINYVQANENEPAFSESKIIELVNEERVKNNMPKFSTSSKLNSSADAKAIDIFEKKYWAHNSPSGLTPWKIISNAGYNYKYAGENLAEGYLKPDEVVQAWMDSPTHSENILSKNYKDIGVSTKSGVLFGRTTTLVVLHLGVKK